MIDDQRLADELRAFYRAEPVLRPDRARVARAVLDEVHGGSHAGRSRWRLPALTRGKASARSITAADTTAYQPSPIPATNGHTPTVTGRTQTMFSPVKAITAGALVFAIGGVLLLAQPFQQQSSVPGAEATVPPVEVSGVRGDESSERCQDGDREARDGYIHEFGYTCTEASWTMSDPRLEGEVTTKFSVDFYSGEFADLTIGSSALSIENAEGAWRERAQLGGGFPWGSESEQNFSVLDGEGAYEGLLAVLEAGDWGEDIRGFIFDGEFPPPPDNASTR